MSICKHCGLDTTEMSGPKKASHVRWCPKNPKIKEEKAKTALARAGKAGAWNKGKTKETDSRLKDRGEKLKARYDSGELVSSNKGVPMSQDIKDKISKTQRENDYIRVNKNDTPYDMIDGSTVMLQSSWEIQVAQVLDNAGIIWKRPNAENGLLVKWYDKKGFAHKYYGDFYIPEWNVYLDPKNDWVSKDQEEKWEYLLKNYDNIFILKKDQLDLESIKSVIEIFLLSK